MVLGKFCSFFGYKPGDILIKFNIVFLHDTPVPPLESHLWRTTVNLQHLPSRIRHHTLKCFVATAKVGVFRAIVLVRVDNGVIGSDFERVLADYAGPPLI